MKIVKKVLQILFPKYVEPTGKKLIIRAIISTIIIVGAVVFVLTQS